MSIVLFRPADCVPTACAGVDPERQTFSSHKLFWPPACAIGSSRLSRTRLIPLRSPAAVWKQKWVVDVQPAGSGEAAIKYLSAYVYRTALGSQRILNDQDGQITFKYKDSQDQQWRHLTLSADEFIRRFLQHVLPSGLQRVRYYGWLSAAATAKWSRILILLNCSAPAPRPAVPKPQPRCPHCAKELFWIGTLVRGPPLSHAK